MYFLQCNRVKVQVSNTGDYLNGVYSSFDIKMVVKEHSGNRGNFATVFHVQHSSTRNTQFSQRPWKVEMLNRQK